MIESEDRSQGVEGRLKSSLLDEGRLESSPRDEGRRLKSSLRVGDARAQRALLAHLRHELRTPLNAILGYSEMLIEDAEGVGQEDLIPDLSKIHDAGAQLLSSVDELLDPDRASAASPDLDIEAFGATLRHELRTPLNAVIGYSEILIEDAQDQEELVSDLEKIRSAGQRFLTLVDDVVTLSEAKSGQVDADLSILATETDTSSLVQDAMSAIRPLVEDAARAGAEGGGAVLVVDDNEINRDLLARHLQREGRRVTLAENGRQALGLIGRQPFDLILLDIMMPEMNGYEVLKRLKGDPAWRDIPVIMISALSEMDSIVRCIELGAEDYLPKPFNPVLLRARTQASLDKKRLRDLEVEYLRNVALVADAAAAVEEATFASDDLASVAVRRDELGRLARVFQRMAEEVHLREQRLKRQLQQLHLDMEEMRKALVEPLCVYMPMDRRQSLVRGQPLPERTTGAALFADVSGFSPLTAALARELGRERGAEELIRQVNQVYDTLTAEVHRYGGSVIGFSGDAITCWFNNALIFAGDPSLGDPLGSASLGCARGMRGRTREASSDDQVEPIADAGLQAVACALAMQRAMEPFASVSTPQGTSFTLGIKVAVVTGDARRFLVGDAQIRKIEVLAGGMLDRLARAERCAGRGEVVIEAQIAEQAGEQVTISDWRQDGAMGQRFAVISGLTEPVPPRPWPELPPHSLADDQCRPWLLPSVYQRLCGGGQLSLADLRPVTALFLRFGGIDYDADDRAEDKLEAFVRWVQEVIDGHRGSLIQVTTGDKGSYLYAAFGAPVAHEDDAIRAVYAALALQAPPRELAFLSGLQIGVALGQMRTGAYGSTTRRTYGAIGEATNLAAGLMMAAGEGILCDEALYQATRTRLAFETLSPIAIKGRAEPVPVFRPLPTSAESAIHSQIDRLPASQQLALKVASVVGRTFSLDVLEAIFPLDAGSADLHHDLGALERRGLITQDSQAAGYRFQDATLHQVVYDSMLFVQRRHLHRQIAEWYERTSSADPGAYHVILAHHWLEADEPAKAADYLEKAGGQAAADGEFETAERLFQQSLELEAEAAALSADFYDQGTADYEGAIEYALTRLEAELAPALVYHNLWHTKDEVLPAARRLAKISSLDEDELQLLEVGAAYHDIGFTVQHQDHERAGAEIAAEILPGFGFSPKQVAAVQGMIMATQLPQSPQTPLEEILADADLDVLGRKDFSARNKVLREEMAALGTRLSDEDWFRSQLAFLQSHHYFTAAARTLREKGKEENLEELQLPVAARRAE